MKILIATTYLYNSEWPEFTRNKTGFGIMVRDIMMSISKYASVIFISHVITKGHKECVVSHSWKEILANARVKDWLCGIKVFFKYRQSVKDRLRTSYYWVNRGFVKMVIQKENPDIVHIHGIGFSLKPYIEVCEEMQVPYIVTLHGLIGLSDSVETSIWNKQFEKDFLIYADEKNIPVTVISSGIKRRIESSYLQHRARNITVICNGTKVSYDEAITPKDYLNLRKEYNIQDEERIAVVIGSICTNKNQEQVVRAFCCGRVKTPCRVFLCGIDGTNGKIIELINSISLNNKIHVLGFLPQEKISQILDQVDVNIVASKEEGFGLSIIEAFCHGIPTVTFADLDAVQDLYIEDAMILSTERTDYALANAIQEALSKEWDRVVIKNYATNFSIEKMAEKYMEEIEKNIWRRNSIMD